MKSSKKPFLAWKKEDFIENNQEIPGKLLNDDLHTEGELMSEDEILLWIKDTEATFRVIREQNETRFQELFEDYKLDLEYLAKIGKINTDSIEDILNNDNFHF